jgi:hypothetical protein
MMRILGGEVTSFFQEDILMMMPGGNVVMGTYSLPSLLAKLTSCWKITAKNFPTAWALIKYPCRIIINNSHSKQPAVMTVTPLVGSLGNVL